MCALHVFQSGAYTPEQLDRLQFAFDIAWAKIAPSVSETEHARSRDRLAGVIVSAGKVSNLDASELAITAERLFESTRTGESMSK